MITLRLVDRDLKLLCERPFDGVAPDVVMVGDDTYARIGKQDNVATYQFATVEWLPVDSTKRPAPIAGGNESSTGAATGSQTTKQESRCS